MQKILILSHNPITTYQNMGKTMASLFSAFDRRELCQLYIYPTIPDIDFCSSYYRVTDKDIFKSYFKFTVKGRQINNLEIDTDKHSIFENPNDLAKYKSQKNKTALRMLLRDIMWKFSRWYNKDLSQWLKKQQPKCVFVAPGDAKFIYDIAIKISKKLNIPIISYICDDYYFVDATTKGVLDKHRVKLLQNKTVEMMKRTKHIITICNRMAEIYSKEFLVPATTIMTGTNYTIQKEPICKETINAITYMGNIRCKRFVSLVEIGKCLHKLNKECGSDFSLKIYTSETDEEILSNFADIDTIKLCGYVSGEEFDKVFHSADVLLHTEAFDEESIDLVKNSVSTKIADSLASGICLFAYGPKEVASMKHLINNQCAVTVTEKENLYSALKELFLNSELRENTTRQAIETAKIYHNSKKASYSLKNIMEKINENTSS